MVCSTGCTQLDDMLEGGIPERRAVLVTGGPGVGKSTLAMQFLQEGLRNGEDCLFISTEQTVEELESAFAPFSFELDHPQLEIASIHALASPTIEKNSNGLVLGTLEGTSSIDGHFRYPFESEYLVEYLEQFGPCDRVVLDSTSGLEVISENPHRWQRAVLDLIRLFTDEFDATAILTSEASEGRSSDYGSSGVMDSLQFTTHGVIRLWWGEVKGSRRRFLEIVKMRGIDHGTLKYEVDFTEDGLTLVPQTRTSGRSLPAEAIIPTGVAGLDELCGGLARGHSILAEYDSRSLVDGLVAQVMDCVLEADMSVWFFPSPVMSAGRTAELLPNEWDFEELLSSNRLFVMDSFGAWKRYHGHRNVFSTPSGILGKLFRRSPTFSMHLMKRMGRKVARRRTDAPQLGLVYTEAFLRYLEPDEVKEVYYWAREELAQQHDTGLWVHNPHAMDPQLAEFFHSDAVQVFETTMAENGIQYLRIPKSPIGQPGESAVIDFDDQGLVLKSF